MEWYFKKKDLVFHFIFLNSELSQYDDEERRGKYRQPSLSFFVSVSFTNCLVGEKTTTFYHYCLIINVCGFMLLWVKPLPSMPKIPGLGLGGDTNAASG